MLKNQYGARGTDTPWYQGWQLTEDERAVFRATTMAAQAAKRLAMRGELEPKHEVNRPSLDPTDLMPQLPANGIRALSLFSGGGGMDIGFARAGFDHVASYEIMESAAETIRRAYPKWTVFGDADGDVTKVEWFRYRGLVDVLHGGPPCQPFSHAGRQNGAEDARDLIPEMVRAVKGVEPSVFVLENVSGLTSKRFQSYVQETLLKPLGEEYKIGSFILDAADFGVPQRRRRVFFVGFRDALTARLFTPPKPTHCHSIPDSQLPRTMGARKALGLADIGCDGVAPTLRSGLTGPRHTTSVVNSVTALRRWNELQIWPNGVAADRVSASRFTAKNGHFRMALQDCLILQGFPADWPITTPVYFALGLIGNSVAPPMSYHLSRAIAAAVEQARRGHAHEVALRDPS